MNSNYIRKIDILDLIMFNLRHVKGLIAAMLVGILLCGGYRLNEFRITLNNAEYVNSVQAAEKVRASCVIYVNGKEYSNSASERVVDMSSIVKSYDVVNTALTDVGVSAEYKNVFHWIYTTVVANNMVEVCIDLSAVPDITQEQARQVLARMIEETKRVTANFAGENYVSLVEEVHDGSYYLDRKTNTNTTFIEVDKVSELIGVAKYCVLGAAAGLVTAVFCMCVFYLLSTVLRTEEDMCHGFGNIVIGKMLVSDKAGMRKAKSSPYGESAVFRDRESMRKAKTVIVHGGIHQSINLISITDKENRDDAARALASVLSVNGSQAVLIDACKRTEILGKGLYAYIDGKCKTEDIIGRMDGYDVAGRIDEEEAIDIFAHPRFKELVDELKQKYDYVVVNSPAYKKSADGIIIAAACDKTVVVAGRNIIREDEAVELRKNLTANEVQYAGVLLTK